MPLARPGAPAATPRYVRRCGGCCRTWRKLSYRQRKSVRHATAARWFREVHRRSGAVALSALHSNPGLVASRFALSVCPSHSGFTGFVPFLGAALSSLRRKQHSAHAEAFAVATSPLSSTMTCSIDDNPEAGPPKDSFRRRCDLGVDRQLPSAVSIRLPGGL